MHGLPYDGVRTGRAWTRGSRCRRQRARAGATGIAWRGRAALRRRSCTRCCNALRKPADVVPGRDISVIGALLRPRGRGRPSRRTRTFRRSLATSRGARWRRCSGCSTPGRRRPRHRSTCSRRDSPVGRPSCPSLHRYAVGLGHARADAIVDTYRRTTVPPTFDTYRHRLDPPRETPRSRKDIDMIRVPPTRPRPAAFASVLTLPLALTACGGAHGGGSNGGCDHDPARPRLLQQRAGQDRLAEGSRRLRQAGRRHHPARGGAGRHPDPEGAAAGVVQDAARRADARQPRHPADRRHAARSRRWTTSGSTPTATPRAWSTRPPYQGKLYGLQPITNTIALFYNKDILAKAGVTAAEDLGRAEGRGEEADRGQAVRLRVQRHRRLRGHLAVPAVHVVQRRRREEHRRPRRPPRRCSCWIDLVERRLGVQVRASTGPRPTSTTSSWPARPR